jgi:hypothetical protein
MRKARLLSTVAATFLMTLGAASAQDLKKETAPTPAPAAQQNAPAEKVAPNMKAGEKNAETHKMPDTVGQAPKASDADKTRATDKGTDKGVVEKGTSDKGAMDKGSVKSSSDRSSSGANMKPKTTESKTNENAAQGAVGSKESQSTTTGQGAAAGSAKLSTEQRTKIAGVIRQKKVESVHLNVSVSVGTRVPESVHFYPLPQEVFVIYPEWRGYDYILVGDQIVIVDPRTHEIVAILEA